MLVSELLLNTLENLKTADFDKFIWYLSLKILDGYNPIARYRLENATRQGTVTEMIDSYGETSAVNITLEILKKMNVNDAAEKLKNKCAEGNTAATSTSSSASAPPAAPATISAQQQSVIIAPTITNCTTGALNISINKT